MSLEPQKLIFDNPFGNFSNLNIIKRNERYKIKEYSIGITKFDVSQGLVSKEKIKIGKLSKLIRKK